MNKAILFLLSTFLFIPLVQSADTLKPGLDEYNKNVKALFTKYCTDCHGSKKEKGDVRIDTLNPDIINGHDGEIWEEVLELLNTAEMPPDDEDQPTPKERAILTSWLNTEFKKAIIVKSAAKSTSNIRRMTRYELNYAIEDLLKIRADLSKPLPEEAISRHTGLKNSAELLVLGASQLESYMDIINNSLAKVDRFISNDKPLVLEGMPIILKEITRKKPPVKVAPKGKKKKKKSPPPEICKNLTPSQKGILVGKSGQIVLTLKAPPVSGKYRFTIKARVQNKPEILSFYAGHRLGKSKFFSKNIDSLEVNSKQLKTYSFTGYLQDLPLIITDKASPLVLWLKNDPNRTANNLYIESCDFVIQEHREVQKSTQLNASGPITKPRDIIRKFAQTAFRRPLSSSELDNYDARYTSLIQQGIHKATAMIKIYSYILSSPKFFFLGTNNNPDSDFKLAENLSFLLWSSVPDNELLSLAYKKQLHKPEILRSQVRRMLKDDRSKRLVENFSDQWLQTEKMFNIAVDNDYYKTFKQGLHMPLLRQEVIESVNDVFRNGQSALNLIKSDHVFINDKLAKLYDIPNVKGNSFRKVKLAANSVRGGLLTQGAFLVSNSDGISSHSVKRGIWLIEKILNDPPAPPPKNVPDFDDTIPGFDSLTLNQKLAKHRDNDACRNCHSKIDPWGLMFEHFDASGAWREQVMVKAPAKKKKATYSPVESTGKLPGGLTINGTNELKNYLIKEKKEQFARGLTEKLLSYALWRDIAFYDREMVQDLNQKFIKSGYSVSILLEEIALSKKFQRR